jgi:hypothetical protein
VAVLVVLFQEILPQKPERKVMDLILLLLLLLILIIFYLKVVEAEKLKEILQLCHPADLVVAAYLIELDRQMLLNHLKTHIIPIF